MKRQTVVLILTLILQAISTTAQGRRADLVLINGKIFTSNADRPTAEAIAISGDRIMALGTNESVKALGRARRIIDLQGRTVVPGFNDAHAHFGPTHQGVDLKLSSEEPTWAEVVAALENLVPSVPKGKWIFGVTGEQVVNDPLASRAALDRIASNNPVMLTAYFGHGALFNTQAMKELNLRQTEPDPAGGYFERDAVSGALTGKVFEYPQWNLERRLVESQSDEILVSEIQKRMAVAAGFGVTSMQIMPTVGSARFMRILEKADVPIRVRVIAFSKTTPSGRNMTDIAALARLKPRNRKLTAGGIKWIIDGTPIERNAAVRSHYRDKPGWRGRLNFDQREIEKMLEESLNLRQQALFHSSGDRSLETIFDSMDAVAARRKVDWPSKRVRIEHGEGFAPDLIARGKKLGVIVTQNPTHFTVVSVNQTRWGNDSLLQPQRSMIDGGLHYAIGSDGPVNPFLNIMFASIDPWRPSEAITRERAVVAYTNGSAFAEYTEKFKGMLAIGMVADLAVLSQDIFTVPTEALPGTTSVMTVVGGKIIHDTKVLK